MSAQLSCIKAAQPQEQTIDVAGVFRYFPLT
jgi:hypothetical protein